MKKSVSEKFLDLKSNSIFYIIIKNAIYFFQSGLPLQVKATQHGKKTPNIPTK